jgi:hypothetical protein
LNPTAQLKTVNRAHHGWRLEFHARNSGRLTGYPLEQIESNDGLNSTIRRICFAAKPSIALQQIKTALGDLIAVDTITFTITRDNCASS